MGIELKRNKEVAEAEKRDFRMHFPGPNCYRLRCFKPSPDRTIGPQLKCACAFEEEESRRRTENPASRTHLFSPSVSQKPSRI